MKNDETQRTTSWIVEESEAGVRLDVWLAQRLSVGRAHVQTLIADGHVRVSGRRVRKSHLLEPRESVELAREPTAAEFHIVPEPSAPLDVRWQTPDLLVVNKPPEQPTHPMRAMETGTLANALLGHHPELRGVGYRAQEPGLLHRLDNGTSGLLVAARHPQAFEALRESLRAGKWIKHYLALVSGQPPTGEVHGFIGKEKGHRSRAQVFDCEQPGVTRPVRLSVLASAPVGDGFSLVEVSVSLAARHQIRAQLAAMGHPIVGDDLYRGQCARSLGLQHHVLHASRICVPDSDALVDVACELPAGIERVVRTLGDGAGLD